MEMGDCMEEMKMISNVGYEIGKKAKLHDFEILRLFEFIKYDQYHEFFKQITSIARNVKISLPDQLFKYDFETFEIYVHALWEGFMKSCSHLTEGVC